ncbi:MAG: hypothetical protein RJA22_2473 [Verrucomicrobiota bacterium]
MSEPLSAGLFFSVPDPVVAGLPHLLTALDGELMAKVAHLTGSKPGLWHLPAPLDEEDVWDPLRDEESTPFARWALPGNQAELMGGGRWVTEALFGTHCILLDAGLDEPAVLAAAQLRAERHDNGGFYQEHFEDWAGWPRLLALTPWALVPVAPDRSHGLFVAAPGREEWVRELAAWCGRVGRTHWRAERGSGGLVLVETAAPAEARARAAAGQVDMFLARMDRYFRMEDGELRGCLAERLEAVRRLRAEVARARAAGRPHHPAPVVRPGRGD